MRGLRLYSLLLVAVLATACAPLSPAPAAITATLTPLTAATAQTEPTPPPTATPVRTDTPAATATAMPEPSVEPLTPTAAPAATEQPTATAVSQAESSLPEVDIIVDNRDAGFSFTGSWFVGDGGQSYNGDCHWAPRGTGNIAYYNPQLPVAGSYEVFGWWCGDIHHDQTTDARIYIYPTQGRIVPFQVHVDLQQNAGRWVSLGTYYLETNASLSTGSNLFGNLVADADRFVYRAPDDVSVTPTPAPTRQMWTNHPPSPLEQLSAGDLSARFGLVQWMYPYTPVIGTWEGDFDDCQVFPRTGCSGQRHGWEAHVKYEDEIFPYRVSSDYRHVSLEYPLAVSGRQTLYLMVTKGAWFMRFDRYPDDTWWASSSTYEPGDAAVSTRLDPATVAELRRLAEKYNTVRAQLDGGFEASFYGLGRFVEFEPEDAAAIERLVEGLRLTAVPVE
jgi:hypothetical protein